MIFRNANIHDSANINNQVTCKTAYVQQPYPGGTFDMCPFGYFYQLMDSQEQVKGAPVCAIYLALKDDWR